MDLLDSAVPEPVPDKFEVERGRRARGVKGERYSLGVVAVLGSGPCAARAGSENAKSWSSDSTPLSKVVVLLVSGQSM